MSFLTTLTDVLAVRDSQDYLGDNWDAIGALYAGIEQIHRPMPTREQLVEIAALAFAAIDQVDDREPERVAFEDAA